MSKNVELVEAEAVAPITDPGERFEQLFGPLPGLFELGQNLKASDVLKGRQSPSPL